MTGVVICIFCDDCIQHLFAKNLWTLTLATSGEAASIGTHVIASSHFARILPKDCTKGITVFGADKENIVAQSVFAQLR